jgi:hypothetical protein
MSPMLTLSAEALREVAERQGVCVRPIVHEVTDHLTSHRHFVPTPCGATLASKCPPCAHRNRVLRMQQCREGWHLDHEPQPEQAPSEPKQLDQDQADRQQAEDGPRRVRSTRRRGDAPDLPHVPLEDRTVGRSFTSPSGRVYRPSMFATFTLPSYGRVRSDGTPVDPASYDYRRAALDALHFAKLVDRFWQNLRRTAGFKVQYFAVVEPQRRLAPHLHAAIRGAIPRATFRRVVAATYHQVWWPAHDTVTYPEHGPQPVWTDQAGYVDPATGVPLRTWQEALDELEQADVDHAGGGEAGGEAVEKETGWSGCGPAHVLRFGRQMDLQGIIATEGDADRRVGYLTKYLAKTFGDAFAHDAIGLTPRQRRHVDRLLEQVRVLPCSPRCWNWLAYGIQPDGADAGMTAGCCPVKAHDGEHLGCGGRRVLVSRLWTGKTLDGHRADRAAVVRKVLEAAGVEVTDAQRLAAETLGAGGRPRFAWRVWNPLNESTPVYRQMMARAIAEKVRWRREYEAAKAAGAVGGGLVGCRAGPGQGREPPRERDQAATLLRPPDRQPGLGRPDGGQG